MSPQNRPTTQYVRTRGGRMIHRATCSWLAAGGVFDPAKIVPWDWAKGKTVEQIRQEMAAVGLDARFCGHCIGRN